jgi:hypothetical protein
MCATFINAYWRVYYEVPHLEQREETGKKTSETECKHRWQGLSMQVTVGVTEIQH